MEIRKLMWCAATLLLSCGPVAAVTVTATVDPAQISVGDTAQLTVTVSGAQEQPTMPAIDGLVITRAGQQTQFEFINGAMSENATSTYEITPQHDGTFTIPALHVGGASSQPVTLRVGSGGAAAAPSSPSALPNSSGPVVQPNATATAPDDSDVPANKFGSLEIVLPKDHDFYEGELVPADVRLLLPMNVHVESLDLPQISSDAFTAVPLANRPDSQTNEVIHGRPYTVCTWHTALAAVKTGEYPIALSVRLTVIVPQRLPQLGSDDLFDNFFRNAMTGFGTQKDVTLTGDNIHLKVEPLPSANKPADFTGAVGHFDIATTAEPRAVAAGDPITLKMSVTGRGNFSRVNTDLLASDDHWKTYPPKSKFTAQDGVGYEGEKTFEQPIIAKDASVNAVPSLSFSFFDPEIGQYVTRTSAAVPITVSGAPAASVAAVAPAASATPNAAAAPAPPAAAPSGPELRPNKLETGAAFASLRPAYLQPAFVAAQAVPLLALLGGLAFIRRHRRRTDPGRVRASQVQQAIQRETVAMDAAMREENANAFFVHARNALQQRFGREWNVRPEAITLADFQARPGAASNNVRSIFQMADQASYSGLHFEEADLRQWRGVVEEELMEKTS